MFTRNRWKNFKAFLLGLDIALLLCEIILRIYNPFPFALQKGKLVIPANQSRVYDNKWISRLDKKIYFSRNSLGFRGPEMPSIDSNWLRLITIGGSTTACTFLSDSNTWPFLLEKKLKAGYPQTWLNNAGIDMTNKWVNNKDAPTKAPCRKKFWNCTMMCYEMILRG
jgi:hypothetical protein